MSKANRERARRLQDQLFCSLTVQDDIEILETALGLAERRGRAATMRNKRQSRGGPKAGDRIR